MISFGVYQDVGIFGTIRRRDNATETIPCFLRREWIAAPGIGDPCIFFAACHRSFSQSSTVYRVFVRGHLYPNRPSFFGFLTMDSICGSL